jgi:hypothetical protein
MVLISVLVVPQPSLAPGIRTMKTSATVLGGYSCARNAPCATTIPSSHFPFSFSWDLRRFPFERLVKISTFDSGVSGNQRSTHRRQSSLEIVPRDPMTSDILAPPAQHIRRHCHQKAFSFPPFPPPNLAQDSFSGRMESRIWEALASINKSPLKSTDNKRGIGVILTLRTLYTKPAFDTCIDAIYPSVLTTVSLPEPASSAASSSFLGRP